ncbi:hypothetical protein JTE90_021165 [Oedothorax gibbosus]|uniref:Palmitoyltransferase n=1 Tax=Oedothorax gibbosus TaxID=931172 RepID=A0AAV6V4C0_9ARAC|nr:hypothetical protein JTE90_021165 [Oedothorax gibbosus]
MAVFRLDPCGIICMILTYLAVFYADYAVVKWMVIPTMSTSLWGAFNVVCFNIIVFLLIMAHMRAVFSDPGMVPFPDNNLDFSDMHSGAGSPINKEDWTVCNRCETYRPPRAHHCRICRRCVRRMDHHCPWINNCVGELNQKYFIQFLIFVGLASLYSVVMVVISWTADCIECKKEMIYRQHRVIHTVLLLIESILFGVFVIAIMCDQFQAILSDETAIEHLQKKGPHRPRKPKMALLSEVFGRGSPLLWAFPCQSAPRNIENLASYEV